MDRREFLPVSRDDMISRGWDTCDFVFVTGDAYVDHPSFAAAILSRVLENAGYRVGIIAQPPWKGPESTESFLRFGQPRLAWLVSAGAMDSMVAHYTANNKPRSSDAYSPGGKAGFRPDRALITYCAKIREVSKNVPVIIGGIEASMRRFGHYDYWSNTVRHSILLDTKADVLVYGMGEKPLLALAERLAQNREAPRSAQAYSGIRGTMWRTGKADELPVESVMLPEFSEIRDSPDAYCRHFVEQERNTDPFQAEILVEKSESRYVIQEKPSLPLDHAEFDRLYDLPFTREAHPDYPDGIPALQEVLFSLTSSRGCFGACSFCAITFHQGRLIQTRSIHSLVKEAKELTRHPQFKGYIHDVGGPTANFRKPACPKQEQAGSCRDRQCLGTEPCPALQADHTEYRELLRTLRGIPGIKKVFVRSGIRYDYLQEDKAGGEAFLRDLCEHHVSGQLKVAPEHSSNRILKLMRKGSVEQYRTFAAAFQKMNESLGKKQYLIPYYIASHPGATLEDALHTALELKKSGFVPDQVQDFYPTPGTLSTCMYFTGMDPYTGTTIHVARGAKERALQRALLQFNKKENHPLVRQALRMVNRSDLLPVLLPNKK
ncbi:MAG TPA: YgiQ family radical SAM protein [Treponemataceae bacterium]|jgi:uncharacterized radical SAM protein YgiQ|nr:YgiQ family radical SAM protein [Treponemataceae bacterium]